MQENGEVSPELFWRCVTAYQITDAVRSALEIDIFTAIDNGARTASAIAEATGAHPRGIRILCDALCVLGFVAKSDGEYSLTRSSAAFLSKNSRSYLGSTVDFILSPMLRRGFDELTSAVRHGGSQIGHEASLSPESPMWVDFARGMMPMMFPIAQLVATKVGFEADRPIKVLDVAAGHGIYGISVAQQYPNAQVHALDWANVLTVASENAEQFGVADRYHLIPGSAFDTDLGDGYDLVLMSNFLHHFSAEENVNLLKRVREATTDDGKVITVEFVPNEDRVSPPAEAMFSLVMLAGTPEGDAYTFSELKQMFETAGFTRNEHVPLPPMPNHLVISQK